LNFFHLYERIFIDFAKRCHIQYSTSQGYLMCEALLPGPFSAAKNVRHKVACQARNATMMPKEKLEGSFNCSESILPN
jgi:hypothetical protein